MPKRENKIEDIKDAFFPVDRRPVYTTSSKKDSNLIELPGHFAIVDAENEKAFSVVTGDYELVTNQEAYDFAAKIMSQVFQATGLNDLECFNIIMPKSRSFCHIDLAKKGSEFKPWQDDKWVAFLRITNSYNRTRLLRYELGFCRWICKNGMIFGKKSIEFSSAHIRGNVSRIHNFENNIGLIREIEATMTKKLHHLKRFYVPQKDMLGILCKTFSIKPPEPPETPPNKTDSDQTNAYEAQKNRAIKLRNFARSLINEYFEDMGPHGYAALNVLTDFATYPEGLTGGVNRVHSLQTKCGEWIDEFVESIQKPDFSFDEYLGEYREYADNLNALL